jgi:hypothetical protein
LKETVLQSIVRNSILYDEVLRSGEFRAFSPLLENSGREVASSQRINTNDERSMD